MHLVLITLTLQQVGADQPFNSSVQYLCVYNPLYSPFALPSLLSPPLTGSSQVRICTYSAFLQMCLHHLGLDWSIRCFMLLVLLPLLPFGMIHQIKFLVPFSTAANLLFLVGLSLTFYVITQDLPPISDRPAFTADITKLPLFFSTVLCAIEGIGTVSISLYYNQFRPSTLKCGLQFGIY